MLGLGWQIFLAVWWAGLVLTTNPAAEHKIHNIVLYPDKHSWCKTTEIKQIVAYPGCSSVEIDNNVCVGACFSYSIPRSSPSAPGEVITPYCDSCQPAHFTWKEVKLTCESESDEEEGGAIEMIKKVQVISNCTCASCEKSTVNLPDHHKYADTMKADVPELMSLMMQNNREEEENDEEKQDSSPGIIKVPPPQKDDIENVIELDEEKDKEKEVNKEEDKLEIVHVNHKENEGLHLVEGPHHSLVLRPEVIPQHEQHPHAHINHHKMEEDDEEVPSLLQNKFKVHDHEEYPDQIAVESRKEFREGAAVLSVPELIYKEKTDEEKLKGTPDEKEVVDKQKEAEENHKKKHHTHNGGTGEKSVHHSYHHNHHHESSKEETKEGVKIVEVPHHHLTPAVEGVHVSYQVKNDQEKE